MEHERLIDLLLETMTLKWMPRTAGGCVVCPRERGGVAEHSFGVAFLALALLDSLPAGERAIDREKVLIVALLHDLAEVRVTDLPASAVRLIPAAVKSQAEDAALAGLLAPLPSAERAGSALARV